MLEGLDHLQHLQRLVRGGEAPDWYMRQLEGWRATFSDLVDNFEHRWIDVTKAYTALRLYSKI
jgi:hypothetical protein